MKSKTKKVKLLQAPKTIQEENQAIVHSEMNVNVNPEMLIAKAIDKNLPIESLEKLLSMRKELKDEWSKEQYYKALSQFQKECPVIAKKKKVNFPSKRSGVQVKYSYSPLGDLVNEVKDLLESHGFSFDFKPDQTEKDCVKVLCHSHHIDGWTEITPFSIPVLASDFMNDAHSVATALSYAKRYAFCNAFGIMTKDEDNDASNFNNKSESQKDLNKTLNDVKKSLNNQAVRFNPDIAKKTIIDMIKPYKDRCNEMQKTYIQNIINDKDYTEELYRENYRFVETLVDVFKKEAT